VTDLELRPILLDAAASAEAAAGASSPGIVVPDISTAVRADGEMLREILLNLLLNACQSGSAAPIEISVFDESGVCRIDIADRGEGFRGVDPEQLFEAFHTTKKSGTGLGLAIVRRLLSIQGGTIRLIPRDGGGAIARVTLPTP
jgi:signal transduction histidine kinase